MSVSVGDLVNMAESTWKVIETGHPSAQIATSTANAVPAVADWQSLSGARGPKRVWMQRENRVGWPFDDHVNVGFTIEVNFEYGATYRGGGLFIPNIYVAVPECFVGWNYEVDVEIQVGRPTNAHTDAAPIARLPVRICGAVTNPVWSSPIDWRVTLFGNGHWEWG
jgi:hypothetical protein